MRKEILFAIGAGLIFGLIIAFGVWRANKDIKETSQTSPTPTADQKTTPKTQTANPVQEEMFLTLISPEDMDVYTQNPIIVSGKSRQDSWVTISTEEEDYTLKVNGQGDFSQEVELTPGINQLVVTAFDESGNWKSENLNLVFSSRFAKENE